MDKRFFYSAICALGLLFTAISCSDNDDPKPDDKPDAANIEYTAENAVSWGNYMYNVANLLKNDATTLYNAWNTKYESESYTGGESFASLFKNHNSVYTSALNCVDELIEGCITIADEVGNAKIGDPYSKYVAGNTTEALYAVESWYSWHSRDDYTNNIWSIRNAYYGSLDGTIHKNSLSALVATTNADLDTQVKTAIANAATAIQAIPQPFRNNINSYEARAAMDACETLTNVFESLKGYADDAYKANSYDSILDAIVDNYVDGVVLPTYKSLMEQNTALLNAITTFRNNPSDINFSNACDAWLVAREPWEKSEAFLFGPVDHLGLDPNMDSWPLDQVRIVGILDSGNFSDLEWGTGDDDDAVEEAQSARGFHTLEFLLFKDGKPRTIQ